RTTQVPPDRASTIHSVAIAGAPGTEPSESAAKRRGGSHAVTVATESMPGPKCATTRPPSRSSISVGTNQAETPGPLAMACQTSSGVPGTSTSTSTDRRPDSSIFTDMWWLLCFGFLGLWVCDDHEAMRAAAGGGLVV